MIFFHKAFGQEDSLEEYIIPQKEYFKKGEDALNNSNGLLALYMFHSTGIFDLNTEIEHISKKRVDSLLPIYQKQHFEKIKGKWKLKHLKTQFFSYEYIEITDDEILFYDKNNSAVPSRIEKIKFAKHDPLDIMIPVSSVEFQNTEIWRFSLNSEKGEERLYPNIDRFSDGTSVILLDERAYITDTIKRKKALEEDITYYLREDL